MTRTALYLLIASVSVSIGFGQDSGNGVPGMKKTGKKVDNPAYTMWAKYKPGTSVTMKTVSSFGGTKSETETRTTLKSVSDDKVVISVKTTMHVAGQKIEQPASEQTHEAKIDEWVPTEPTEEAEKPKTETSDETLTVADKEMACKKTVTTMKSQGQEIVTTSWTCKDVPGEMVKSVTKMAAGETTMMVTAWEIKK